MTGWKPVLNIDIGQFDHADIGTSDMGIRPQIGRSLLETFKPTSTDA